MFDYLIALIEYFSIYAFLGPPGHACEGCSIVRAGKPVYCRTRVLDRLQTVSRMCSVAFCLECRWCHFFVGMGYSLPATKTSRFSTRHEKSKDEFLM